ncbi:GSCFA domain-containing protein [Hansschlegelia sp.]|uniref:GSCFA domain-containing protein n=1 Tax=Hansschlegelia sp. TaxID=2041892 RepID=UPI002C510977|nr:GSCFA domain-containing protein [Hansschlegelia sp.]HVI28588.1 GSCFA domain-containing protein [Hansschlegelia sp.]
MNEGAPLRSGKKLFHSQWPKREAGSRLVGGCDPYHEPRFKFSKESSFFTIGSCFARNIEEYLGRAGVRVATYDLDFPNSELKANSRRNDLLVKYTPGSIHLEIASAFGRVDPLPDERYLVATDKNGGYHDVMLPFDYPAVTLERGMERRRQIRELFAGIANVSVVVITLGLIEHWYDNELGIYINSRPGPRVEKLYPGRFAFRQLDLAENRALVEASLDIVHDVNPSAHVILTTSPVPLGRTFTEDDVIVANAYSKAVLRVIAQEMARKYSFVDYFPSYEIVTMSPPDMAWEQDLRHVRDTMVGEVMKKFFASYFTGDDAAKAEDATAAYAKAKNDLDAGRAEEAFKAFKALEPNFADDRSFWLSYCLAAVEAKKAEEADRVSLVLMEKNPGPWAEILRGRALALGGDYSSALSLIRKARENPRTAIHASGWEMQVGRDMGDAQVELAGALSAADAILSDQTAAAKKRWVTKRMVAVLAAAGRSDKLNELRPFLPAEAVPA